MDREEFIKEVDSNYNFIKKAMPMILQQITKSIEGDNFHKIEVENSTVYYGIESYRANAFSIKIYFWNIQKYEAHVIRTKLFNLLNSYFGIDVRKYGVPLDFRFFRYKLEEL